LLTVKDSDDLVKITGKDFAAQFSRRLGTLTSLKYYGTELLATRQEPAGPVTQFFRAPADNDRGFGNWLARNWQEAGLADPERTVESFKVKQLADNLIEIKSVIKNAVVHGSITQTATWLIRGDGSLDLASEFLPDGDLPPLPRIGIVLKLAGSFDQLSWYGHGPHENYSDRLESSPLGIYHSTVNEQAFPYPRPQETGNKEEVRWLALRNSRGSGLLVMAEGEPFAASALRFTAQDLAAATHNHELNPRDEIILSLDARHCGLGNGSCGPGVLTKYAVPVQTYSLHVGFRPVDPDSSLNIQTKIKYQQ
jgi:beta-galactosidase